MRIYYNTNGFPHHALCDVVDILADLRYDGIALTPDVHHLHPLRSSDAEILAFRAHCERRGLAISIESGARFVLDPRRKHQPNLLSDAQHEVRAQFYCRLIDIARLLGAPQVSIWSGAAPGEPVDFDSSLSRLAQRLVPVLDHARARGVVLSLEPEPGMLVDTVAKYRALRARLPAHDLRLTIDLGHLAVTETPPFETHLTQSKDVLALVHADDSKVGRHDHLFFGEGDLDFPRLCEALHAIGFQGPLIVELSRHGHDAVRVAKSALEFLRGRRF